MDLLLVLIVFSVLELQLLVSGHQGHSLGPHDLEIVPHQIVLLFGLNQHIVCLF